MGWGGGGGVGVWGRKEHFSDAFVRIGCDTGLGLAQLGLGWAQLLAQIWFEIEDFRPAPYKFSGPFELSRV